MSISWVGHLLMASVFGALILAAYRAVNRRSTVLGAILAAGIVLRVLTGSALFWVSYLGLPFAKPLQVGGGFWYIALDATGYYQLAARAVDSERLFPLDHTVPSPFFVDTLALWMGLVGVSPAAGMFLNLLLYSGIILMLARLCAPVNEWRRDLPCIVAAAAYSFSPVILLNSTQPLKDDLALAVRGLLLLGVLELRPLIAGIRGVRHARQIAWSAALIFVATLGTAGVRWYDAIILMSALLVLFGIFLVFGRTTSMPKYLLGSTAVFLAAWLGFWGGSGNHYEFLGANIDQIGASLVPQQASGEQNDQVNASFVDRILTIPRDLVNMVQISRKGFLMSGGNTNVVIPIQSDAVAGAARAEQLQAAQHATAAYQAALRRLNAAGRSRASGVPGTEEPGPLLEMPPAWVSPVDEARFRAIPVSAWDHVKTTVTGLGLVFVPVTILRVFAEIRVEGNDGMIYMVDIDTIFQDLMLATVLCLLWNRRRTIGDRLPLVIFVAILATATAVLVGYVVTNFGTLWRLRPLVVVPVWMLVVALRTADGEGSRAG